MYGYRPLEVVLPRIENVKDGVTITLPRGYDNSTRRPVLVSLGCHYEGATLPHPDDEPMSTFFGCLKRICARLPQPDEAELEGLGTFVKEWVQNNMVPLSPDTDVSVENWLLYTNYPLWRKGQLLNTYMEQNDKTRLLFTVRKCKCFQKDEVYSEFKYARAIFSRTDDFKLLVGPIFKQIEKELFKLPWFIKKIPVIDRPRYIMDRLYQVGATYVATDYTSFESSFTSRLMENCEFILYEYMVRLLPSGHEWLKLCRETLLGRNYCYFKHFKLEVNATRMSGEMCTSLGNSFSNLMFMLYLCKKMGIKDVHGVVEGDDGLFTFEHVVPTPSMFSALGLSIKIESHKELNKASFCGLIFDKSDLNNVTNPVEEIISFGWSTRRYCLSNDRKLLTLLRAKSYSMLYQYPGCPMLRSLAEYGLLVSRSISDRQVRKLMNTMSEWDRVNFLEALQNLNKAKMKEIGMNTRKLVSDVFGIPIEIQLSFEKYVSGLQTLVPFTFDLSNFTKPDQAEYYKYYNVRCSTNLSNDVYFGTRAGSANEQAVRAVRKLLILPDKTWVNGFTLKDGQYEVISTVVPPILTRLNK